MTKKVNLCINKPLLKFCYLAIGKVSKQVVINLRIIKEEKQKWVRLSRRLRSFKEDPEETRNQTHTSSREPSTIRSQRKEACCLLINRVICKKPP